MKKQRLGRTGLSVSKVGFGCTGFWARPIFPERKALALLESALERGVNLVDSGPSYGEGTGERRLGKVLASIPRNQRPIVSIKVGTHFDRWGRHYRDFSPKAVRESVHGSLSRLQISTIDLLTLHGPGVNDVHPSLIETLVGLKRLGTVRHLAINSENPQVIQAAVKAGLFETFMVEYNFLRKYRRPILTDLGRLGVGILVITPTARSLFRKSLRPTSINGLWKFARALRFHRDDFIAARQYDFLNSLPGITGAQAALAFALSEPHVSSALFATTSADHLASNVAAADIDLSSDILTRLRSLPDGEGAGSTSLRSIAAAVTSMLVGRPGF